jgi:adenylate kinase
LVYEKIKTLVQNNKNTLLEGYPRSWDQVSYLEKWLKEINFSSILIFNLETCKETIIKRLKGRYIHNDSGRTYHEVYRPPKVLYKDDFINEELTKRDDDVNDESIDNRIDHFNNMSFPVIKDLREKGYNLFDIKEGDIGKTTDDIINIINKI